jgi:hypothetical protein
LRDDRRVLPLPANLKGGAAEKVITSLIAKGLVEEVPAELKEPVWRTAEDDQRLTLVVTGRAFEVLGIEPEEAPGAATDASEAAPAKRRKVSASRTKKGTVARAVAQATKTRSGTKQAVLIDMLRSPNGASIEEIMSTTGWQSHTVRGALAGALKKKLGLTITSDKIDGRGRVYRIPRLTSPLIILRRPVPSGRRCRYGGKCFIHHATCLDSTVAAVCASLLRRLASRGQLAVGKIVHFDRKPGRGPLYRRSTRGRRWRAPVWLPLAVLVAGAGVLNFAPGAGVLDFPP